MRQGRQVRHDKAESPSYYPSHLRLQLFLLIAGGLQAGAAQHDHMPRVLCTPAPAHLASNSIPAAASC